MIRVLFDDLGDRHNDLILKVDVMPTFVQIADTYHLADFLGVEKETKETVRDYLYYFRKQVQGLTEKWTFIVFDLSDQYVGGFLMKRGRKGLINAKYGYSDEIKGWATVPDDIGDRTSEIQADFKSTRDWQLSHESVLNGLDWSINNLSIS